MMVTRMRKGTEGKEEGLDWGMRRREEKRRDESANDDFAS